MTANPSPSPSKKKLAVVPHPAKQDDGEHPTYFETDAGIFWNKSTRDGFTPVRLCNFTARIVSDVVHDDGSETRGVYDLEILLDGTKTSLTVSHAGFQNLSWLPCVASHAVVEPGFNAEKRVVNAIRTLSGKGPRRVVYTHLGFRDVNGETVYLHGGGAIAKDGLRSDVATKLDGALGRYVLPPPPTETERSQTVQAFWNLISTTKNGLAYALLAFVGRSLLGPCPISLYLAGSTGTRKSTLAALALNFFGPSFENSDLTASWNDTPNALAESVYRAKDAPFVIDDFCPRGSATDVQRLHGMADKVLRGIGNGSNRGRMNADGSLKPTRPPRGSVIITGEEVPSGDSLRGRLFVVEMAPNDVDLTSLTTCQKDAKEGRYALAMSALIHWLLQDEGRRKYYRASVDTCKAECRKMDFPKGSHPRTADNLGNMLAGLRLWADFMESIGRADFAKRFKDDGEKALKALADTQTEQRRETNPVDAFFRHLRAALQGGSAHLVNDPDGANHGPNATCIGFVDKEKRVCLLSDAALAFAKKQAEAVGEPFNTTNYRLGKMLKERGLLLETEQGKTYNRRSHSAFRKKVPCWVVSRETLDEIGE